MSITLRPFQHGDLADLSRIYRESICLAQPQFYSPEQVDAWSSHAEDRKVFEQWVSECHTTLAVDEHNVCLGFCGHEDNGRIASLFVHPQYSRRGVGSELLRHALADLGKKGLTAIRTEASEYSRPLFEKFGFTVQEIENKKFKGIVFQRYLMRREQP